MKKLLSLALIVAASASASAAPPESFQEFRQGLLNDFSNFRSRIIEHYSDFLNGEWHEYEPLKAEVRDATPKPLSVPTVKKPGKPGKPSNPSKPSEPAEPVKLVQPSEPAEPVKPVQPAEPVTPETPAPAPAPQPAADLFNFYGMPMQLPKVEFNVKSRALSAVDFGPQWQELSAQKVADALIPSLRKIADDAGFNDYLTYRLISDYVDSKLAGAHETARASVVHYLLASMGYDARIGLVNGSVPVIMLPARQTLYGKMYLRFNNRKYYLFLPSGRDDSLFASASISTCTLPDDATKGNDFDMRLSELRIPVKPHKFDLQYGPLHLTGEVNENLMPILYRYPQMPMAEYAQSVIQPELRRSLVEQVRQQLAGLEGDSGVEALLSFMHNAFDYATDGEFHGFEKPYFIEETLFYPKNDCEDRAIFYTYFLWNALGRKARLVSFPGHEAATVQLSQPVEGTSYADGDEVFYISDPTYVGASTGMVMPPYRSIEPQVDFTYR